MISREREDCEPASLTLRHGNCNPQKRGVTNRYKPAFTAKDEKRATNATN
jgi:hypothetical protein